MDNRQGVPSICDIKMLSSMHLRLCPDAERDPSLKSFPMTPNLAILGGTPLFACWLPIIWIQPAGRTTLQSGGPGLEQKRGIEGRMEAMSLLEHRHFKN